MDKKKLRRATEVSRSEEAQRNYLKLLTAIQKLDPELDAQFESWRERDPNVYKMMLESARENTSAEQMERHYSAFLLDVQKVDPKLYARIKHVKRTDFNIDLLKGWKPPR